MLLNINGIIHNFKFKLQIFLTIIAEFIGKYLLENSSIFKIILSFCINCYHQAVNLRYLNGFIYLFKMVALNKILKFYLLDGIVYFLMNKIYRKPQFFIWNNFSDNTYDQYKYIVSPIILQLSLSKIDEWGKKIPPKTCLFKIRVVILALKRNVLRKTTTCNEKDRALLEHEIRHLIKSEVNYIH